MGSDRWWSVLHWLCGAVWQIYCALQAARGRASEPEEEFEPLLLRGMKPLTVRSYPVAVGRLLEFAQRHGFRIETVA